MAFSLERTKRGEPRLRILETTLRATSAQSSTALLPRRSKFQGRFVLCSADWSRRWTLDLQGVWNDREAWTREMPKDDAGRVGQGSVVFLIPVSW